VRAIPSIGIAIGGYLCRRRVCDARGKAVVSIKWGEPAERKSPFYD